MLKSTQQGEGKGTGAGREKRSVAWSEMEVFSAASGGEGGMLAMGNVTTRTSRSMTGIRECEYIKYPKPIVSLKNFRDLKLIINIK